MSSRFPEAPRHHSASMPWVRPQMRFTWLGVISWLFLCVLLSSDLLGNLSLVPTAHAASRGNPNPTLSAPGWLQSPHPTKPVDLGIYVNGQPDTKIIPIPHPARVTMTPFTLTLTSQAQHVVSSDGTLEITVPAGSVSPAQVQAAGGKVLLKVVQLDAGSGGSESGRLFLGTYQLLLQDAAGKPLTTLVLAHPLTLRYHLLPHQHGLVLKDQVVYALWHATALPASGNNARLQPALHAPKLLKTTVDPSGGAWSLDTTLSSTIPAVPTPTPTVAKPTATAARSTPTAGPATPIEAAAASSTITFSTESPQASWGTPQDFQVGLNAGGLNYSYPLALPAGPGGLTPPLTLTYASGAVNESHNVQAAAPWLGEGWSLSLGSISWSQENVTPGSTNKLENVWHITDPSGISGQLIPPDVHAATSYPQYPTMTSLPAQYIWQTTPESHAKVQEVNFNGAPCWHVWLPNGTMEEFGCTNPSRQSAQDAGGHWNAYRWDLDLLVDRYGNQVRINYQQNFPSGGAVRDAVISSIEYDDPSCHNTAFNGASAACSSWNPKVRILFDASTKVTNLSNPTGGCQNWSSTGYRCDDPVDLSASGGLPIAKVINTYVLNDVQVQVQGNLLHKYVFSYEQSPPLTLTDPLSGQQESAAGYLDLTRIQEQGTNGTTLNAPLMNLSYQSGTQHYEDLYLMATPTTNCGPSWTPRNGNGCFLWAQSYNARYLTTLDNGRGWHETITWAEAHANVHGVDSGEAVNDPFSCDGKQSTSNLCGQADDQSWSRMVVKQRNAVTNGVTSTWTYRYYIRTGWPAPPCANCLQGYSWGNQNDADYADYYNGQFESFASAQVILPDGSSQIHYYASTNGWGLAYKTITCFLASCNVAPYWAPDPGMAGHEKTEQDFGRDGKLLHAQNWTYAMNCPPPGVSHSNNASGPPYNPGDTQLISELDQNNPVVVCDPRATQEDDYQVDGVTDVSHYQTDARVVHKQTTSSYDGDNQGSNQTPGYDYGNLNKTDVTANDVNNEHFLTESTYWPNDNLGSGIYLTNLPGFTHHHDAQGITYDCTAYVYGSNPPAPHPPSVPAVTQTLQYPTPKGGCAPPSYATLHTYDSSGNALTATDPDNHQGCSSGSTKYSVCAIYDAFDTHLISTTNAKNQTTTYGYDASAAGGFGQWETSTTDVNGQTTTYQYDALGRLTAVIKPGDSTSSPTIAYAYLNTCTNGATAPCLELDTITRVTVGGPTTTTRQWYDGMGHLIETRKPGPNSGTDILVYTIYDGLGRATTTSLSYGVPSGTGYVAPDLTKARTVTTYDGLGRSLGSVTYSDATTIVETTSLSYTVAQGVPSFNIDGTTAFERTITLDAYQHQSIQFTDALGRDRYEQVYAGTGTSGNPYRVIRTVQYNRDTVGDVTSVRTYDKNATQVAYYTATYDGVKRVTGWNDADSGSCSNTPLPAGCSSSSDTAWKVSYDADGNQLSQIDPRGKTIYTSFDVLDRPLCRGTSSAAVNPCQNSAYALFFYDSYDNSSNPSATLPSGCVAPSGAHASYPVGNMVAEVFQDKNESGWRCLGYDARDEQTTSMLSVTLGYPVNPPQTITQTVYTGYNDAGQVNSLTYPDGETVTSNYDTNGYFQGMGTANGTIVNAVTYTNTGQVAGMTLGGITFQGTATTGVTMNTSYDGIQRPLSLSASVGGNTIFSQTRTYDNIGNVIGLNTTIPTTGGGSKTDIQSYCYDELNRLVWAGNAGAPAGGDHCGAAPTGTTVATYAQSFSYDAMDRFGVGPAGNTTYDSAHVHAASTLSAVPNQYASYDAMGNMTCRNMDTTTAHSCDATQTGATMIYDNEGRLTSWKAPSGTTASDSFLYDNEGHRVLQRTSKTTSGTTTAVDTITFDGYTETTVTNGKTTNTTKYYSAHDQRVAMATRNSWYYLVPDMLGSTSLTLNGHGTASAVQLFAPYGAVRYTDGSMSTTYNFTGQRLDSLSGLLYYDFRYYNPVSGSFMRADTLQTNTSGMNPYAYVSGNPVTMTDPTGHLTWEQGFYITAIGSLVLGEIGVVGIATGGLGLVAAPFLISAGLGIIGGMAGTELGYAMSHNWRWTPNTEKERENFFAQATINGWIGGGVGLLGAFGGWGVGTVLGTADNSMGGAITTFWGGMIGTVGNLVQTAGSTWASNRYPSDPSPSPQQWQQQPQQARDTQMKNFGMMQGFFYASVEDSNQSPQKKYQYAIDEASAVDSPDTWVVETPWHTRLQ